MMGWLLHTRSSMVWSVICGFNLPGQRVLLCQRLPGKLRMHCSGPYVFSHSVGPNSVTLELLGCNGKVRQALVGNVVPYHGSADWEVSQPTTVQILRAGDLGDWGIVSVRHGPG